MLHRNMKTHPESFLQAISPYRDDLVVVVECMFTWYGLTDLCVQEDIKFILGHAQYMAKPKTIASMLIRLPCCCAVACSHSPKP